MWRSVKIIAPAAIAETLSEALMDCGALSVSLEDADAGTDAEKPQFGEPNADGSFALPEALWDRSVVVALVDAQTDIDAILKSAAQQIDLVELPPYSVEEIEEQNWVKLTQEQFDPIQITSKLWIVPSWHNAPDHDAINIALDPGMAFGTGTHPTTQLCLEYLSDLALQGKSMLDYGCGSGILAIAAAKLGATHIVGIDIEDAALIASAQNAERNQVSVNWRHARQENISERFDFVLANILTKPLCMLAPTLCAYLAPQGRIALSGVLLSQADEVIAAYAPYIKLVVGDDKEGWVRLQGIREKASC